LRRALRSLAITTSVLVAGAAGASIAGAQGTAQDLPTRAPGVLTVGLNLPTPGFQVGALAGTQIVYARGLEVDLAREVARRMGLRGVRFVQVPTYEGVLARGPKTWDVAFAQATITAGRKRAVTFSVPYLGTDEAVLLRRGLPDPGPSSLADLKSLRLCVERGTTGAAIVPRRIRPATRPTRFREQTNMLQALQAGRCDAVILDATILGIQQAATPERYGRLMGRIVTGERYGAVMQRGSALLPAVNRALNSVRRDGTLDRITARWLKVTPESLPVIPATGGTPAPINPVPLPPFNEPVPLP
jgi:polar amino acid transport system substrate-binding protein